VTVVSKTATAPTCQIILGFDSFSPRDARTVYDRHYCNAPYCKAIALRPSVRLFHAVTRKYCGLIQVWLLWKYAITHIIRLGLYSI